jgi:hypothetical protein
VSRSEDRRARKTSEIGWREIVGLPEMGIPELKAKIDTGARTSALHAVDLETWEQDGGRWVSFHLPLADRHSGKRHAAPIVDERPIKNTSGRYEKRYIVETTLVLGRRHWRIELSLANRENMEMDLILGRTAIRRRKLLVNPGRSFLAGPPVDLSGGDAATEAHEGLLSTLERGT